MSASFLYTGQIRLVPLFLAASDRLLRARKIHQNLPHQPR
jgi:hypothetical protein